MFFLHVAGKNRNKNLDNSISTSPKQDFYKAKGSRKHVNGGEIFATDPCERLKKHQDPRRFHIAKPRLKQSEWIDFLVHEKGCTNKAT